MDFKGSDMQQIGQLSLVVNDYDEAIEFYTQKLGFKLLEDQDFGNGKRWVRVTPSGSSCSLLLAKAVNPQQAQSVGNQTGGRVFLFLYTDDFWRDYEHMLSAGVKFIGQPREEAFGTVVVFEDLYGNKWDFIQSASS